MGTGSRPLHRRLGRGLRPAGVALVLAAGLALVAVWAWRRDQTEVLPPETSPPPAASLAVDRSLGVTADLSAMTPEARDAALAAIEAAGFRWVRQRFAWDAIEAQRGVFVWDRWDEVVEAVDRHNLRLIAVLDGSPRWARAAEDEDNPFAPPVETRDFGAFAAALAARYGGVIDAYQLWDEPNIAPHWGARWVDPGAYTRLLREGAIQIRAADAGAVVLLAALAPTVEEGGANMSDVAFLDALYEQGAQEWFDVVAAQPYGFDSEPEAAPAEGRLNYRRPELLRRVMLSHGDENTAVWATAFGWSAEAARALQAPLSSIVESAIDVARQNWPWMGPMLWAAWSPSEVQGSLALGGGAAAGTGALEALRAAALAPPIAYPGVHPPDDRTGVYEGEWRVSPVGADIGRSGDRLTIPFWGTGLDLTVRRGPYQAFLFVSVDGQPANSLPKDRDGRSYVVLYDSSSRADTVPVARGLPAGPHRVEIVADRGWGQWAIAGWSVWREAGRPSAWLAIALSLSALTAVALAAYAAWPQRGQIVATCSTLLARYRAMDVRLALAITAAAALVAYVAVGTLPTLLAGAVLGVALVLRPETGLPLVALALPFYQVGRPVLGKVFSMVEIMVLLTGVAWLIDQAPAWLRAVQRRTGAGAAHSHRFGLVPWLRRLTALDWAVLALVLVGAGSLLWVEHLREAAREFRTVILEAGLFYALLRLMVRDRSEIWRVLDGWVLGGLAISLVAVVQWASGQNLITAEGVWRVRGFYGSPNNLALYLGRLLPLAVAVGVWGTGQRRRWPYAGAAAMMAVAIALTYSRGAWLLGVPISLLFLAALRSRRALLVTAGLLLAAAVVLALGVGGGRVTTLLDAGDGTTFFRLQLWESSWAMIRDHPVLGVGLDNFLYAYRSRYVLPTAWEEFNLSHPHNVVLDFWLRLGLLGLAVLVWLLAAFFRAGWSVYRRARRTCDGLLAAGLMAGMAGAVAHGLVDSAFFLVDLAFVFMIQVALIHSLGREAEACAY